MEPGLHLHVHPREAGDGRKPGEGRGSVVKRRGLAPDHLPCDQLVGPEGRVEGEPRRGERAVVAKRRQQPCVRIVPVRQDPEDSDQQHHEGERLTRDQSEDVSRSAELGDQDETARDHEARSRSDSHRDEHEGGSAQSVARRQRDPLGADDGGEGRPPHCRASRLLEGEEDHGGDGGADQETRGNPATHRGRDRVKPPLVEAVRREAREDDLDRPGHEQRDRECDVHHGPGGGEIRHALSDHRGERGEQGRRQHPRQRHHGGARGVGRRGSGDTLMHQALEAPANSCHAPPA